MMNKQTNIKELFSEIKNKDNQSSVTSSADLHRIIDLGTAERTKYFSNKIRLDSHRDLVSMAKLEQRNIATILEKAIACYKQHQHPNLN